MTTTKEKIAIMQAFEDGEIIEFMDIRAKEFDSWEIIIPLWNWADKAYRVKPKSLHDCAKAHMNSRIGDTDASTAYTSFIAGFTFAIDNPDIKDDI